MKSLNAKLSLALGIPLTAIVVSLAIYLSLPDPTVPAESPVREIDPLRTAEGAVAIAADEPQQDTSLTLAGTLLQKYAESEAERQKEMAAEGQPPYVPPPLALLEPDPEIGLNDAQARKLEELRQSFIGGLSKLGKDADSPEYLEYWTQEQARLDEEVRLHLGEDIFLKLSAKGFAAVNTAKAE